MINELIPPDTLAPQLLNWLAQLNAALAYLKKAPKNTPPGHLRVAQKGGKGPYFYHYTNPQDFNGKYIRKKQLPLAKALAQKDYTLKLIKLLEKESHALSEYLIQSKNGTAIQSLYKSLCPARQNLVTPATFTDQEFTAQWKDVSWQGLPFAPDAPQYDTANGEVVRSKSEVIIADTLARYGIPYRYEFPLQLKKAPKDKSTVTFYPDFCCLNIHSRKEIFWEHFGLMDDSDYASNAAGKLRFYAENGILPGRNLIITMETQKEPLNKKLIEIIIREFLL